MKAKVALLTIMCAALSSCATVDLANAGGPTSTAVAASASASNNKVNVVQRAVSKLYAAFTTKGWVASKSRKRVQSAASVLLRGLDSDTTDGPLSGYAANTKTVSEISGDVQNAQNYVTQTTKAAEVYLAMASDDTNLREELASLQKALIASREAELLFKSALSEKADFDDAIWTEYSSSVDALRDVTDAFGDRVRSGRTMTSALQAEIN